MRHETSHAVMMMNSDQLLKHLFLLDWIHFWHWALSNENKKHDKRMLVLYTISIFSSSLLRKYQLFPTSVKKHNNNKKQSQFWHWWRSTKLKPCVLAILETAIVLSLRWNQRCWLVNRKAFKTASSLAGLSFCLSPSSSWNMYRFHLVTKGSRPQTKTAE